MRFIQLKGVIKAGDLVDEFGYSLKTARNKIYRLEKAKLIEKLDIRVAGRIAYSIAVPIVSCYNFLW